MKREKKQIPTERQNVERWERSTGVLSIDLADSLLGQLRPSSSLYVAAQREHQVEQALLHQFACCRIAQYLVTLVHPQQ